MGRHAAHRRTYHPALAALRRILRFLLVPGGRPRAGTSPGRDFTAGVSPGRCPCAGIFPGLDSSRAGAFPVREFTAGAFPDGCAVREPDPRDRRDRGVERFGGQHEEYRRFAPAALLCHPEALQDYPGRRRRLVERPDQHRLRQPRADAQCGIRQGVLEARPAVGVGRVVAVQPAQQGDLRPDRVERRLDERRRVEHPLFVGDQRVEEFLAVGDAPQPRGRDHGLDRRPVAEFQQRFDARRDARLHHAAHPPAEVHFGDQLLDVAAQPGARCDAVDVEFHFAKINEQQLPPNPNEFESTERTSASCVRATGCSPSSGIGSANPGLP